MQNLYYWIARKFCCSTSLWGVCILGVCMLSLYVFHVSLRLEVGSYPWNNIWLGWVPTLISTQGSEPKRLKWLRSWWDLGSTHRNCSPSRDKKEGTLINAPLFSAWLSGLAGGGFSPVHGLSCDRKQLIIRNWTHSGKKKKFFPNAEQTHLKLTYIVIKITWVSSSHY